jgi:D-tyrosyl-tRNA(Tyr) deacylase
VRSVVQRVREAQVLVDDRTVGRIGRGLLVLAGFAACDDADDVVWMARMVATLRVFPDGDGRSDRLDVGEAGAAVLAVSQFTLLADCGKGRRPSYDRAMGASAAAPLFARFVAELERTGAVVATGRFGATMRVRLVNDGPLTLIIDSRE